MTDALPKYDRPPVIETVLSAQFAPLPNFSAALAGWFWKQYLSPEQQWTKTKDVPRLDDQFERFGNEAELWASLPSSIPVTTEQPTRTQIIRGDDERMIQVQDSRFVLNWRKQRESSYPTYDTLLPEFKDGFQRFERFVRETGIGEVTLNQWEVTYVNHIPKGELWQLPSDWSRVLPGVYVPPVVGRPTLESLTHNWRFQVEPHPARLYVNLRHGRTKMDGPELMILQFTARGPIDLNEGLTLEDGFATGREIIVRSFDAMASAEAKLHWGRRD